MNSEDQTLLRSKFFDLNDLTACCETSKRSGVASVPRQQQTIWALQKLCDTVLEPAKEEFGEIKITYGLCTAELQRLIPRGISSRHDQHASYELSPNGRRICDRDGAACDFLVPGISSLAVAKWVVENIVFDRLYYYGDSQPLHVSIAPSPLEMIVVFRHYGTNRRRIPNRISRERFLRAE